MGRLLFGGVLAVIGLLYLAAAVMTVSSSSFGQHSLLDGNFLGAALFFVVGVAAAVASVNLLREKRH